MRALLGLVAIAAILVAVLLATNRWRSRATCDAHRRAYEAKMAVLNSYRDRVKPAMYERQRKDIEDDWKKRTK